MRLMTIQWLAIVGLLFAGIGCSSTDTDGAAESESSSAWFSRSQPKDNTKKHLIEPEAAAELGYRLGWASPIKLLKGQKITSVTAWGDLIIVVEAPVNTVTALKAGNGELAWKITIGSELEDLFAPSRDDKQLFIHSATRMFTIDTRRGEVTAVADLETTVGCPGVYTPADRLMIMSGVNGMVFAHSVDNNFARWRYRLANRISSPAVLAGQDVFAVDTGGTYAMIEIKSGNIIWRNRTLGQVNTAPGIQDSEVIVASADGKMYALNRSTGKDTWQYLGAEQPLNASPSVLGRLIIQPLLPNNGLVALDSINGNELWRSDISATPVLARRQDLVMLQDRKLLSIDLDDGSLEGEVATRKLQTVVPTEDGSLVLVSPGGRLLKISPN